MGSGRRTTPTVSNSSPLLFFAQHTKLLYALFKNTTGSKAEAKKEKKNRSGAMFIFQLTEVNAPLIKCA